MFRKTMSQKRRMEFACGLIFWGIEEDRIEPPKRTRAQDNRSLAKHIAFNADGASVRR